MIASTTLKFGSHPGSAGVPVSAAPVTVFDGPNNSGKSKVLSEIAHYCLNGVKDANARILEDIAFIVLEHEPGGQAVDLIQQPPGAVEAQQIDHIFVGSRQGRDQVPYEQLLSTVEKPTGNPRLFPS